MNSIIYAEVYRSATPQSKSSMPHCHHFYQRELLPWEAGFLAGKCFLRYRRRGGLPNSPLPDFYIGAHAAIIRLALLTRDAAR
jgi:hypothetical protein